MGKLRLIFTKEGRAVYISHLDLLRTFQRAFLRQGLVLRHSQGFHPHPILSFALPLNAPGQNLLPGPLPAGVEFRLQAALGKGLQPAVQVEAVAPGVQLRPLAEGFFQNPSQPPVPPGQHGLQEAGVPVVPVVGDGLGGEGLPEELPAGTR